MKWVLGHNISYQKNQGFQDTIIISITILSTFGIDICVWQAVLSQELP